MKVSVEEFAYFRTDDRHDTRYDDDGKPWSRPYEYMWVLDSIAGRVKRTVFQSRPQVLNAAWGYEGCHVTFREALDRQYDAIHTDLLFLDAYLQKKVVAYNVYPTMILNMAEKFKFFEGVFDVNLCVSVVEHMPLEVARESVMNLISYTKVGGLVLITFDLPSEAGQWLVTEFGMGEQPGDDPMLLSSLNSIIPNEQYGHLRVGRLAIRRLE